MSADLVRVAVIGLGLVSGPHLEGYLSDDRCELVAVCDVDDGRATRTGTDLGVRSTTDYRQLLTDDGVDAVALLLPHPLHHPIGLEALHAGKHVCLEKPLTVTEQEAEELIAVASQRGLTLATAENTRYVDAYIEAERRVRSGDLGTIRLVRGFIPDQILDEWADRRDPTQDWKREPHGCGAIIDCAPHMMYLLRWYFGDVDFVQTIAYDWVPEIPLENVAVVAGRMSQGTQFTMEFASVTEYPRGERVEIYGSGGTMIIDQVLDPPVVIYRDDRDHRGTPITGLGYDLVGWKPASIRATAVDFIDSIVNGRVPGVSPADARYVVRLVECAYESVVRGGVKVPVGAAGGQQSPEQGAVA